jgi:hypothetical protein
MLVAGEEVVNTGIFLSSKVVSVSLEAIFR